MILADTGPLVSLFDRQDPEHGACRTALHRLRGPLCTTLPVLTEAFHLLSPGSHAASALRRFVGTGGARLFFLDSPAVLRAFELMEQYADRPMDLADASLVVAAERLGVRRVLTLDRRHFDAYRLRVGRRVVPFQVVAPGE